MGAFQSKPFKTIVADSRDILVRTPHPRVLSPLYLARHILGEIVIHASPLVKVVVFLLLSAPALLLVWLGLLLYRQHEAALEA